MMNKEQIIVACRDKREELLDKYFGTLVHEAAYVMPEQIDEFRYPLTLSDQVIAEYFDFLQHLLSEIHPDDKFKLDDVMNKKALAISLMTDDRTQLEDAYSDAKIITLREKISKSNHEDVTYYKGLLKAYTEELLKWAEVDFLEDV